MHFLNGLRRGAGCILACLALLSGVAGCSIPSLPERLNATSSPVSGSSPSATPSQSVTPGRFAEVQLGRMTGEEAFSSSTVQDWVRQADHVAVVRIVEETPIAPAKSEIERREGLVGRMLTAHIQSLVWTHSDVTRELPASIIFQDFGWAFKGAVKSKYRIGVPGRPYLLPGHTYLMALRWFEWGCPGRIDPEDEITPRVFAPLGSGAIVPFDGSLGTGEFEGRWTNDAGQYDPVRSFRAAMTGQPSSWVAQQLSDTAAGDPTLAHEAGPIGCDGE